MKGAIEWYKRKETIHK